MEIREIYEQMHGDYDSVHRRLRDDERIKKFLLRFVEYHYDEIIRNALAEKDYETAFREAHNLKGICANLSIDVLGKSAEVVTEALRGGDPQVDMAPLMETMQADYNMTINALKEL